MNHFHVLNFTKWKKWSLIVVVALFTSIFIWFEQASSFSLFSEQQQVPTALTKGDPDEEKISLTFNISWGEEKVDDILQQLEDNDVQSTFFVSGEWAERHPNILEKITDGKHELGMLGYRYKSYLEQDIEQVREDLIYAKHIFQKLGYEDMDLLRTPSGHFNTEIVELAEDLGFEVVHWNVNPDDWENPGKEVITNTIMKETSNGDIVLLHASDAVKQTADALKVVLPSLKNKGFEFVTVSELINQAEVETEIVK